MTTTDSGYPGGNYIVGQAKRAIGGIAGVKEIDVELVGDPPRQESTITEEAGACSDGKARSWKRARHFIATNSAPVLDSFYSSAGGSLLKQ
jgi:metal-sulfur cluster biosynthetic enzyme